MDADESLAAFRKEWKEELKNKGADKSATDSKDTSHALNAGHVTLDDRPYVLACSSRQCEAETEHFNEFMCQNCSQLQSEGRCTERSSGQTDLGRDTDNTMKYYPFNIVKNLLSKSNSSPNFDQQAKAENKNTNKLYSQVCSKCGVCNARGVKRPTNPSTLKPKKYRYVKERLGNIFEKRRTQNDEYSKESLLDQFLSDLNEITEIPFFDVSLPREVAVKIFKHLDMKDLCRCSQVSKSWHSLAEDELLWCNICHNLRYEESVMTVERGQWKSIVRENITQERQINSNWKNRVGNLTTLDYVRGGILCAANSYEDTVVAGYSNGEVKVWDLELEESCILKPLNTALIIDENQTEGTIGNRVAQLEVTPTLAVAKYTQGNIDIWKLNDSNMQPIFTIESELATYRQSKVFCVAKSCDMVVTGNRMDICVYRNTDDGFQEHSVLIRYSGGEVSHLNTYEKGSEEPKVFIATFTGELYLHSLGETCEEMREYRDDQSHLPYPINRSLQYLDVKTDPALVAVGRTMEATVFDIESAKTVGQLKGHTHVITCLNIADSPPYQVVTGSMDRRVRIFDLRTGGVPMTLSGHSNHVTTVQMDDWKVVSGDGGGFVHVWDRRMSSKLWEWHNRHPVKYCHFTNRRLIAANIPDTVSWLGDDNIAHRRFRGSVQVCDFSTNQFAEGLPEICHSTYDEPEAYNYNIRLAVPYDNI